MKLFECQNCGQPLYFENTLCQSCGLALGYLPERGTVTALTEDGDAWRALADAERRYRLCSNAQYSVCNWLVPAGGTQTFCIACRHNRTIPDLGHADNLSHWRKIEIAKHRLFYSLLRFKLPLTKAGDPEGLEFDFLQGPSAAAPGLPPIMTGHNHGKITLNLDEADDAAREKTRNAMGEPYRTLLGHFRHEIAHYYWDRLIRDEPASLAQFRTVFGDERADYGEALRQHYAKGAPQEWPQQFVTSYASAHPWEDFAETWAHYFHIVDTLETASAFGMRIHPKVEKAPTLDAAVDFDPHDAAIERIIDAWLPLSFAMNAINRSMGLPDLYPFVLAPGVILKLAFVHGVIHARSDGAAPSPDEGLKAVVAGLKRTIASPLPAGENEDG